MAGTFDIPERVLWKLWQRRAARQEEFRTGEGRRVRVLYPGRSGRSAGPDFRDALLEVEGLGLVRGDVEIHLRPQDWKAHGHGADPNYNGVVLHGVLSPDSSETRLHSGAAAPVIGLGPLLSGEPKEHAARRRPFDLWPFLARKGYLRPETSGEASELLDRAGDQRFFAKAAVLRRFAEEQGPEQTLYEALLEGLGYRHNREPFLKLARLAPYSALRQAAMRLPVVRRAEVLAGWMLAAAGLRVEPELPRPAGLRRTMPSTEWRMFRVRPSNHPENRIRGAAWLLARHLEAGLLTSVQDAATGQAKALTGSLSVDGVSGGLALVGTGRARELAVNAVLPLLHSLEPGAGGQEYLELFRRYPKLPGNEIAREMGEQLLPDDWARLANNARRQQGLLHLAALLRGASP